MLLAVGSTLAQDDAPKPSPDARTPPSDPAAPRPQKPEAAATVPTGGPSLVAVVKLAGGSFRIALETERTPLTAANFIELVERGYYDGLAFYQVIPGATVEAGYPINKGIAGPGYIFEDEIRPDLKHDAPGVVSMANVGPNSNGSRFAITLRPQRAMDGRNTIFGRVVSGMDLVAAVQAGDVIERITLEGAVPTFSDEIQARLRAWRVILDRHHPPKPRAPKEGNAPAGASPTAGADSTKSDSHPPR